MRTTRPKRVVGIVVALAVILAAGGITWFIRRLDRTFQNAYAVWNVSALVIGHMETSNGKWPRGWHDLEAVRRKQLGRDVREDMQHLRERVEVDFDVDPRQLARAKFVEGQKEPPFRVIRHRSAPMSAWQGQEPNEMIWRYLNSEHGPATMPATRPALKVDKPPADVAGSAAAEAGRRNARTSQRPRTSVGVLW